jgi:hypothetical protein
MRAVGWCAVLEVFGLILRLGFDKVCEIELGKKTWRLTIMK